MIRRSVVLLIAVLALVVLTMPAGCVRRDSAVETKSVADNLAQYWTCAVFFSTNGRGVDANEGFAFTPWFESRVRERALFEPLGKDEAAESEVTLRVEATHGEDRVRIRVLLVDTKTNESLGELEALGFLKDNPDGGGIGGESDGFAVTESPSTKALHGAAERVLDLLKERRRESVAHAPPKKPLPPAPPLPDGPPVAVGATCSTQCAAPAAATTNFDEQRRVSAGMNETMKELRGCLDRVGAQLVEPAVLLRFSPDGQLRHMRVDVGGYEHLECIQTIRSRPPRSVFTTRASLLRCEYRCVVS